LTDAEIPLFWKAFDATGMMQSFTLKALLLTGQRPGEVASMRLEHIRDGWWTLPGEPDASTGWPGTKNGATHRVWLPSAVQEIIAEVVDTSTTGFVFSSGRGRAVPNLDRAMRDICSQLGVERATPHDLRRTHGSTITGLGFGRDAMNRIQNHREGGIASVYDRHEYAEENKKVMEAVAARILVLADGVHAKSNVVQAKFAR
jgi:integrase